MCVPHRPPSLLENPRGDRRYHNVKSSPKGGALILAAGEDESLSAKARCEGQRPLTSSKTYRKHGQRIPDRESVCFHPRSRDGSTPAHRSIYSAAGPTVLSAGGRAAQASRPPRLGRQVCWLIWMANPKPWTSPHSIPPPLRRR